MSDKRNPDQLRVIVGMSGGVDSSVTGMLCLQRGYIVEGLFMKNWEEDDDTEYCTATQDLADAREVCKKLGIKLHEANFAAEYEVCGIPPKDAQNPLTLLVLIT